MIKYQLKLKPSEIVRRELSSMIPIYRYFTIDQLYQYFERQANPAQIKMAITQLERIGKIKVFNYEGLKIIKYNAPGIAIDIGRIKAFWMLLYCMRKQKIELHLPGSTKGFVKINFMFQDIHHEIFYCQTGNEASLNMVMKVRDEDYQEESDIPRKIIIIDDEKQISKLKAKNINVFAVVSNLGHISLYQPTTE